MATTTKGTNRLKGAEAAETATGPSSVIVSVMKPQIVVFKLTGISPLMQNNPAEFIGKVEGEGLTVGKKTYNDEDEARMRLYRDEHGHYCHPAEAFLKAAIKAVRGKKFGKQFASQLIMGSVFITEQRVVIEDLDGDPATAYTIDRRSVVIGKSRVLRCRPIFMPWAVKVALECDTGIISPAHVLSALQLGGRTVGSGDYRPERGGSFGRFTAEIVD